MAKDGTARGGKNGWTKSRPLQKIMREILVTKDRRFWIYRKPRFGWGGCTTHKRIYDNAAEGRKEALC